MLLWCLTCWLRTGIFNILMSYFFLLPFCNLVMKSPKGMHFCYFKIAVLNFSEQFLHSLIWQDIQKSHQIHFQEWFFTSKMWLFWIAKWWQKEKMEFQCCFDCINLTKNLTKASTASSTRWQWSFKQKGLKSGHEMGLKLYKYLSYVT